MKNYHVNPACRTMEAKGIPMLGNMENSAVIGLTQKGRAFWERIIEGQFLSEDDIENNQELLQALIESDFISEKEYCGKPSDQPLELISAYLHVTNKCNLNCLGCYSMEDRAKNQAKEPTLGELKIALKRLHDSGVGMVVISGGEPFSRTDLYDLLYYGKTKLKVDKILVVTNGTVKADYRKFKYVIDELTVSIDGFDKDNSTFIRQSGIFDCILDTISVIKKSGIPVVSILPTLHKKNIFALHQYKELADRLGVEVGFSVLSVCDDEEFHGFIPDKNDLRELAKGVLSQGVPIQDMKLEVGLSAGLSCGAANTLVSISTDGSVYPCHMLHFSEFKLCNIFETDLSACNLEKAVLNKFLHANADNIKDCQDCDFKYFCSCGCRARAYYNHKTICAQDNYCEHFRFFYDRITDDLVDSLGKKPIYNNDGKGKVQ